MNKENLKKQAAQKAVSYIKENTILGVGTGSTVDYFIEELAKSKIKLKAIVASSARTARLLEKYNMTIIDLNQVDKMPLYVDGADECNENLNLIKGGGGALTREKIIASVADEFICIADASKYVKVLGSFPLPVEVIPMACNFVINTIKKDIGGTPLVRENTITDNGNYIIDIANLCITEPKKIEYQLNQIVGVVTNGLFAHRSANKVILASETGITIH